MTTWLSVFFLVAGSGICLLAAVGVLRLPDFFMRMHAATKAGVAGCGLVLVGVAFAFPSPAMWIKITLAVVFLLLTTPIAGHLLGRAGYVAGVRLWGGTVHDQLEGELRRGDFERPAGTVATNPVRALPYLDNKGRRPIAKIVLGLTNGPDRDAAINHAITLTNAHHANLITLAIVDTTRLSVDPAPGSRLGDASQPGDGLIEKVRRSLADAVQCFEQSAASARVSYRVHLEEGDPAKILARYQGPDSLVLVGSSGWFDHGASGISVDPLSQLVRGGNGPVVGVSGSPVQVRRIAFLHDGSARSDHTWEWLLTLDPWPQAALHLIPDGAAEGSRLDRARAVARGMKRPFEDDRKSSHGGIAGSQVVVFGNGRHANWLRKSVSRQQLHGAPVTVFG